MHGGEEMRPGVQRKGHENVGVRNVVLESAAFAARVVVVAQGPKAVEDDGLLHEIHKHRVLTGALHGFPHVVLGAESLDLSPML